MLISKMAGAAIAADGAKADTADGGRVGTAPTGAHTDGVIVVVMAHGCHYHCESLALYVSLPLQAQSVAFERVATSLIAQLVLAQKSLSFSPTDCAGMLCSAISLARALSAVVGDVELRSSPLFMLSYVVALVLPPFDVGRRVVVKNAWALRLSRCWTGCFHCS